MNLGRTVYEYDLLRALMAILTVFPIPLTSFWRALHSLPPHV